MKLPQGMTFQELLSDVPGQIRRRSINRYVQDVQRNGEQNRLEDVLRAAEAEGLFERGVNIFSSGLQV